MKKRPTDASPWWGKIPQSFLRKMKLTLLLSFLVIFQVGAVQYSNAQKRVSLDLQDVSLEEFFSELRRQTGNVYVFNVNEIQALQSVSVKSNNELETDVLDRVLRGLNLGYKVVEDYVVIFKLQGQDEKKKSLTVKGFVYDEKKHPMPGVTVQVVGTSVGTATTEKGWFSIALPLLKGKLKFSFVGYKPQEVEFTEKTDTLRVYMKEDVSNLDEVQVRAYGAQKKREVISAISTVTADEMKELPSASITSMLQGRLAGVNIIQQSGAPGSAAVVAVRGFNSLLVSGASDGQPLWVVDGVPMHSFVSPVTGTNTLADLDPSMIESVQVLKDAAAASIYGSRAGNGVILITTKKGKVGKAQFSVNVSYTASQLMEYPLQTGGNMERKLDLLYRKNYKSYYMDDDFNNRIPTSYEEAYRGSRWDKNGVFDLFWGNGTKEKAYTDMMLQDSLDPYYNNSTNWWKYVFKTGRVLNANIQASGGTEKLRYIIGLGYYDEEGIMINSGYSRANFIANLSASFAKNLRMDVRAYASYVDRTMNKAGLAKSRYEGISANPSIQSTLLPATKELQDEWLKRIQGQKDRTDDIRGMLSAFLEYEFIKGLTFSASANVDYSQGNMNLFKPSTLDVSYHENNSSGAIQRNIMLSTEELLHYNKSFNEIHNVDVLLGFNANKEQTFYIGGWGSNGASDNVYYYDPRKVPDITYHSNKPVATRYYESDFEEKTMMSYFGRIGYNFKQRYLVEFTFRRDGSSTFGENNRWANFPSVALGWTFSEEPFVKSWAGKWLNWAKIRGSYGTSGQVFDDAIWHMG